MKAIFGDVTNHVYFCFISIKAKMKKIQLSIICLLLYTLVFSNEGYKFRIELSDKNNTTYSINKPDDFLSEKAIKRRANQNITIDSTDLPISTIYKKNIENLGFKIVAQSKWFNTLTVECSDSLHINSLKGLRFIKNIKWVGKTIKPPKNDSKKVRRLSTHKEINFYGYAKDQIYTINGQKLHDKGYKGKGMDIAIIDAGYSNLKDNLYLSSINIGGYKDFVNNGIGIFAASEHGISVLSAMATNQPNTFVGTAPEARYWLLRSEDGNSEYPVEQDYWVTAIEYADSIGVDLVNSSLGYQKFDAPVQSVTYNQLDGKTSFITKAAQKATEKGIFVVVSAGNEGEKEWAKITIPADATNVLTVGSMSKDSIISGFSSSGPTFDNRIKPDIVAMGENINLIDGSGTIIRTNGTSFSTPVMCGMVACLWQAFPKLTNLELLNIIRNSGSKKDKPNDKYGYGAPDMLFAMKLAGDITTGIEEDLTTENTKNSLFTYSSDSIGHLQISKSNLSNNDVYEIRIYNLSGRMLASSMMTTNIYNYNNRISEKQPYIVYIIGSKNKESKKLIF